MTSITTAQQALTDLHQLLNAPHKIFDDFDQNSSTKNSENRQKLLQIIATLFAEIEQLAATSQNNETFSGMQEMYADNDVVDAETIFGQVELQNAPLFKFLKKDIKKFAKLADTAKINEDSTPLQLVDLSQIHDEDEENDNDDNESNEDSSEEEDSDDGSKGSSSSSGSTSEDSEARRIRLRMERSMAEADEEDFDFDDDDDDDDNNNQQQQKNNKRSLTREQQEELDNDPMAKDMNDGFFDVHEMEGFADEEEDLHMSKFGQQQQRQDDEDDDSVSSEDNEDDEDDDMLFREKDDDNFDPASGKKQFREEDEIRALMGMYNNGPGDDDDEDNDGTGAVDPANMTASDFFGRPNPKFFHKYQERQKREKKNRKSNDLDYDSWDDHDFAAGNDDDDDEEEGDDWRNADNLKNQERQRSKNGSKSGSDDSDQENSDDDDGDASDEEKADAAKETTQKPSGRDSRTDAKIRALEEEALAEKPWTMRGEITGKARPENSLLEATPEFELAAKMAPAINAQHTENLEDVIRRRILEEDWDDVIPRELSDIKGNDKGDLPEVSQEKSKLSLGELYEREYLKKAAGYDVEAAEKQTEEEKVKNEMRGLFANLCSKLDALSNYHFAPRPVEPDADIKMASAPAIALEEALPLHVSDGRAAAPEEVYAGKRGRESVLRGDSEMDQVERKRLRSAKKRARRKARQEKLADEKVISKLTPGLGLNNPYEKRKLREELSSARGLGKVSDGVVDANNKDYTQSTAFFKNLQESVQNEIHGKVDGKAKGDTTEKKKSSAFKL